MHVLLCNERLLFRYGHDRVLALLGRDLQESGHTLTVLANHFDPDTVAGWADRVIEVEGAPDYRQNNRAAREQLEARWSEWFEQSGAPDVAIVGGWPFFECIDAFERRGVRTIYFDCGAVPLDGMHGGELENQRLLRALRREHLPHASHIVANSAFTASSQSAVDAPDVSREAILLGADHLEGELWQPHGGSAPRRYDASRVAQVLDGGEPWILCPGRFEIDNYKNGRALFELMRGVRRAHPRAKALVLADRESAAIPADLAETVVPIGFPGDADLRVLMERAPLGVIPSLWEGFGLPLAELQWLGRPTLVFGNHAHDEVAADRAYVCADVREMTAKAIEILSGGPLATIPAAALAAFRATFRWRLTFDQWRRTVERVGFTGTRVIFDVTNASVDPANTGVIRVTRQLARELQSRAIAQFVTWDDTRGEYTLLTDAECRQLAAFHGPIVPPDAPRSAIDRRTTLSEAVHGSHTAGTRSSGRPPGCASSRRFARPFYNERSSKPMRRAGESPPCSTMRFRFCTPSGSSIHASARTTRTTCGGSRTAIWYCRTPATRPTACTTSGVAKASGPRECSRSCWPDRSRAPSQRTPTARGALDTSGMIPGTSPTTARSNCCVSRRSNHARTTNSCSKPAPISARVARTSIGTCPWSGTATRAPRSCSRAYRVRSTATRASTTSASSTMRRCIACTATPRSRSTRREPKASACPSSRVSPSAPRSCVPTTASWPSLPPRAAVRPWTCRPPRH